MKRHQHPKEALTEAASRFFAVRGLVRTRLSQGKRLDPSAWLYIEALKFVSDHRSPSMKELAAYFSITAPSATSLVRGLAKHGLVMHEADPRDRRVQRIVLTARGRARLAAKVRRGMRLFGELFSALSPAELASFTAALKRIQER